MLGLLFIIKRGQPYPALHKALLEKWQEKKSQWIVIN